MATDLACRLEQLRGILMLQTRSNVCQNTYAVIEKVAQGLYPAIPEQHWFEWTGGDSGSYKPCDKPDALKGIVAFSIG